MDRIEKNKKEKETLPAPEEQKPVQQERIQVCIVRNPFKRTEQIRHILPFQPCSLKELKNRFAPAEIPFLCIRNGKVYQEEEFENITAAPHDTILFLPQVQGGGNGEKNVLTTVMMMAVTIAAPLAGTAYGSIVGETLHIGAKLGQGLVSSFVSAAGGAIVNAIAPPNIPAINSSGLTSSQSYSWSPQTTQQEGIVIAKFYGVNKLYGNIIAVHTEHDPVSQDQYLNILIDLGMGPYHHIEDIRINEQPIADFHDIQYEFRQGNIRQNAVGMFRDTKREHPLSVLINRPSAATQNVTVYDIPQSSLFNAIEFDITFPQGLFALATGNSSSLKEHTVQIKWEIVKKGSEIPLVQSNTITISSSGRKALRRTFSTRDKALHTKSFNGFSHLERYQLRIYKTSVDNTEGSVSEMMLLSNVREVFYDDFSYPRHALVGIHAKATGQISGSLRFSCLAHTSKIISFEKTENSTGWSLSFSSNPAEVCFDILCQPLFRDSAATDTPYSESDLTITADPAGPILRYDGINPERIDIDAFREWAKWCDEEVPESLSTSYDTLTTGLLASYRFDNDSLLDATGQGRNAKTSPRLTFNHTVRLSGDASLEFPDNQHKEVLLLPSFRQTGITSALTVACWLYIDTLPPRGEYAALLNAEDTHGMFFAISDEGRLLFSQKGKDEIHSFSTLSTGTWHFVAVTHAQDGKRKLYIDDQPDAEKNAASPFPLLRNGTLLFGNDAKQSSPYRGKTDSIHIWERALNQREIARLYATSSQGISSLLTSKQVKKERRCEFHGGFDFEMTLWDAALQVCRTGRAMLVWNGTKLTVAINRAVDTPTQLFSVGNMVKDSFKETFLPLADRSRNIEIDFINKEKGYKRDKISLTNPDSEGGKPITLQLMGITSPSQAMRMAKLQLAHNQYLLRTISFETDIDAIACTVGDVVHIQHDIPQWGYGGRIISVNPDASSITLDKPVSLQPNTPYRLLIRHRNDAIVSYPLVNYPEGLDHAATLDIDPVSFADNINSHGTPEPEDIYAFGIITQTTKPFRITSLSRTGDLNCKIEAVEYNRSMYDIDFGLSPLPLPNSSELLQEVTPQLSHILTENRNNGENSSAVSVHISFLQNDAVRSVLWKIRKLTDASTAAALTPLLFEGKTETGQLSFKADDKESYSIELIPLSWTGKQGTAERFNHTALKESISLSSETDAPVLSSIPADVTGLQVSVGKKELLLSWEQVGNIPSVSYDIEIKRERTVSGIKQQENQTFSTKEPFFRYLIPYNGGDFTFSVTALSPTGEKSRNTASVTASLSAMDDNLILSGDVDLSSGIFSGEFCTNDFQDGKGYVLYRPSIAGTGVSLPVVNQNDGDLHNTIDAFASVRAGELNYPVSWWSKLQYGEKSRWESGIITLQNGTSISGRIGIDYNLENITARIPDYKPSIAQLSQNTANDFMTNGHLRITLFVSDDQTTWKAITPNSQTSAAYLKVVAELTNRNPATELKLSQMKYYLDVPDITDSGTETIPASQLPFTGSLSSAYRKNFNAVRYVSAVITGGDGTITVTSFDAASINVSVTGTTNTTIHWIAQGY